MAELKPTQDAFANATVIGQPTADIVDLTGAPFQAPAKKGIKPPAQASTFGNHWKDIPAQDFQKFALMPKQEECTQQQQSGGLLNLSDAQREKSRARQQAYIAEMPK